MRLLRIYDRLLDGTRVTEAMLPLPRPTTSPPERERSLGSKDLAPELKARALPLLNLLRDSASYESPMMGRVICAQLGLRSTEDLRNLVNWLRSKGDPLVSRIGSDNRGYYPLESWREAQATIAQLDGRIASMREAVRGLSHAFHEDDSQVGMAL